MFAAALPHPALEGERARAMLEVVGRELLTPFGLRTLSPKDPRYVPRYEGGQLARDGAYHQGTVWPWLLGAYVTAYLRVHGRTPATLTATRGMVEPLLHHLRTNGVGQLPEIFDADPPHRPVGCFAQAWSVAEMLRVVARELAPGDETVGAHGPSGSGQRSPRSRRRAR